MSIFGRMSADRPTREQVLRYLRGADLARRPDGMSREAFRELRRLARLARRAYAEGTLVHVAVEQRREKDAAGHWVTTRTAGATYRRPDQPDAAPADLDPAPGPPADLPPPAPL